MESGGATCSIGVEPRPGFGFVLRVRVARATEHGNIVEERRIET